MPQLLLSWEMLPKSLQEKCLAFSKDSPLGMDLSWIFLPFLCKNPVWTRHSNILAQHRQGLQQQMLLCLHRPGNGPKSSSRALPILRAGFGIPSPSTAGCRAHLAGSVFLGVAEAVSKPLNLSRKHCWDNGGV